MLMVMVVLLLPLSSSMYDGEFNHGVGGSGGSGGHPSAAAVVVVEDNYQEKRPATRVSTVA